MFTNWVIQWFPFGRMFSNKTGSLSAIRNFNFNSLCCSHFLFSRSPSSVLGPRIPFALNVLSTNLLNTFLLILTYLFTYLPNNLASYLLTYFIHTHYSLNHSPIHLLLLTIESIIITVSIETVIESNKQRALFGKIQKRILCFGGQIQKRIMNPWFSGWILRIKSKSGFLRFTFTIWAFFWERIWKKYFWQAVFRTRMVHNKCCKRMTS